MASDILEKASNRMPHNLEAERAVLGCLLQDNEVIDEVFATISSEMFYDPLNSAVFHSIGELKLEGQDADAITVKDQAKTNLRIMSKKVERIRDRARKRDGITESSLSDSYFADLLKDAAFSTNVMSYCNIIKEKYILRKAIETSNKIIDECSGSEMSADEICNVAQDEFYKLSSSNDDKSYVKASSLLPSIFDDIAEAIKTPGGITGVKTSYRQLDEMTAGFQRTDMIILAGRPGMGKTTFALNLAYNICSVENVSAAFFSLEMTKAQLVKKILSDLSGVSSTDMRSGKVSDAKMNDLLEAARMLENKKLFINDNSYVTIADLRNKCMKIQKKEGLDIVFIDYLQLMHAGTNYRNSSNSRNGFQSRQEEIAEISRNIKGLAKDLNVPIVALSQLSREVENRKDEKPQLSDIRESGAIEQDADVIMFLSRPKEEEKQDAINLIIAKHRNGSTGEISFKFDKATSRIKEWDKNN